MYESKKVINFEQGKIVKLIFKMCSISNIYENYNHYCKLKSKSNFDDKFLLHLLNLGMSMFIWVSI